MPKRHGFFPLHWQMTLRTERKKLDKWILPRVGQLTVRIIFVPRGGGRGWGLGDSSQAPSTSAAGPFKWLELKHGLLEQTEKCHHFFFFVQSNSGGFDNNNNKKLSRHFKHFETISRGFDVPGGRDHFIHTFSCTT